MKEKEIKARAAAVAEQFAGCEIMEATEVLGKAITLASKKNPEHLLIAVCYIGKLIESMHGRSALVKINDDGGLSFSIAANGVEQEIF